MMRVVFFSVLALLVGTAYGGDALTCTAIGAALGAVPWKMPTGVLGMNSYLFGFLIEPTTPPVAGDASTLGTLVNAIGNLLFGPPVVGKDGNMKVPTVTIGGRIGINTGAYVPTNAAANNGAVEMSIDSPYRLDTDLMPPTMGATSSGTVAYSAGGGIMGVTMALDNECGTIVYDVDRPIVTEGCGIVAYLPAGVSVSSQLSAMVSIPVCNGQTLVIGRANQTAQQGTYQTPFNTAWAFGVFGGSPVQPVAVVAAPVATRNAATARNIRGI